MEIVQYLNILKLLFLKGLIPTLKLVPVAILFSIIVGIIGGTIRLLRLPIIDNIIKIYISLMRGIPFLVLLFITYFVFPTGHDPFIGATIALILCHGAYIIEIIRGGFESIDKGQREAAKSLGLSFWQIVSLIIFPQALLIMTPATIGQLIILIKDTALASVIGYIEITRMGRNLMQTTMKPFEIFLFVAIYYFILCHALKLIGNYIEEKTHFKISGKTKNI